MMVTINIVSSGEKSGKGAASEVAGAPEGAGVFSGNPAPQAGGLPGFAEEVPSPVLEPAILAGEEPAAGMPVPGAAMSPVNAEAVPEPTLQPAGARETKKPGKQNDDAR